MKKRLALFDLDNTLLDGDSDYEWAQFLIEEGVLHAPATGDVVIRDPATWAPAPRGEQGVVEVVSTLPESYPGHALLTEDLGRVVAVDDCPCGRLGQAIALDGRVAKAELRGCSDVAAAGAGR